MYCIKCGKEVADGVEVCDECLQAEMAQQAQQPEEQVVVSYQPQAAAKPDYEAAASIVYTEKAKGNGKKALIFGIIAMAVMMIAAFTAGLYLGFNEVISTATSADQVAAIAGAADTSKVVTIILSVVSAVFGVLGIVFGATGIGAFKKIPQPKPGKLLAFSIVGLALGGLAIANVLLSVLPILAM